MSGRLVQQFNIRNVDVTSNSSTMQRNLRLAYAYENYVPPLICIPFVFICILMFISCLSYNCIRVFFTTSTVNKRTIQYNNVLFVFLGRLCPATSGFGR